MIVTVMLRPEVWPIESFVSNRDCEKDSPSSLLHGGDDTICTSRTSTQLSLAPGTGQSTAIATTGYTRTRSESGSQSLITTSTTENAVRVHIWSSTTNHESGTGDGGNTQLQLHSSKPTSFELTKLPNWPDVRSTAASVVLPRNRDDLIRIVLNKTKQAWYWFNEKADTKFPLVLNQEVHLIRTVGGRGGNETKLLMGLVDGGDV